MKKKWVLVRSQRGTLFVIERKEWEIYNAQAKQMGGGESELLIESDDMEELFRFKKLANGEHVIDQDV